jgi:hypothetical protein
VKIVGLIPTYQEGRLAWSAINSLLPGCDHVAVFDGPIGDARPTGYQTILPPDNPHLTVKRGTWDSDAHKRTEMLKWAQARRWLDDDSWIVWLDGDEVMLYGEYLPDLIERAVEEGANDTPVGGIPLRLHELEGTTSLVTGRLLRVDIVEEYITSISFVRLKNGETRLLGNIPIWNWRQGPMIVHDDGEGGMVIDARCRPASAGEPQILHRSAWRSRARTVERQSVAEQKAFEQIPGFVKEKTE